MPKVTVVGAGNVGATLVQRIAEEGLADVVMMDIVDGLAEGKALDMSESRPLCAFNVGVIGTTKAEAMKGSDVVVVTAGVARKPGMSREDLIGINSKIVGGIAEDMRKHAPGAGVIVVTNPGEGMVYLTGERTGFPPERVIGMAGELDTARFRFFIADALGIAVDDIQAILMGGHGDSMVPLPEYTTINGIPLSHFLDEAKIEQLISRTVKGGGEIVALLKTGSAFYAPSAAVVNMVRAILRDEHRIFCASAFLKGEYGYKGIYLGVPVILGRKGVEKVIELPLSEKAKGKLKQSAEAVSSEVAALRAIVEKKAA